MLKVHWLVGRSWRDIQTWMMRYAISILGSISSWLVRRPSSVEIAVRLWASHGVSALPRVRR